MRNNIPQSHNTNRNIKPYSYSETLSNFYRNVKSALSGNKLFKFSFWAILLKTLLFILLISDSKAVKIDIYHAFYSVPPVLVYLSFVCIFLSFAFLFKAQGHARYYIFINVLLTVIYIGDIWYYRSNNSFLNYYMLGMTTNLNNLGDSVFAMSRAIDFLFILDLLILIALRIRYFKEYKTVKRNLTCFLILFFLPLIYLSYAHVKVDVYKKAYANQILFAGSWVPNQTVSSLTPIGYHLFEFYDYLKEYTPTNLSAKDKEDINTWFNKKAEILPDNQYKSLFKGKNLIIIQLESFENFVINQKVDGKEITPTLNKLINNSFYFNNYHEQTYNGTTSDAELLTNTSIFPIRKGSTFFRYGGNTYKNSLPNLMGNLGYGTLATHPDNGSYWNWYTSLKSMGFKKCMDASDFTIDDVIGLGLSDASYFRQLAPILEKQKQPFYSFSISLSSHTPYGIPDKDKNLRVTGNLSGTALGRYVESVNYTDKQLASFMKELDSKGLLDNSVIVFYGDHEGVHKFFGDEVRTTRNIDDNWLNNDYKIPLIIYSKGMKPQTISVTGGQADLLPTLGYLFGVNPKDYTYSSMGRNLLNTNEDFAVLANRSFLGKASSEEEKNSLLQGIDISDTIIKANLMNK